jgi:hypothetical protein
MLTGSSGAFRWVRAQSQQNLGPFSQWERGESRFGEFGELLANLGVNRFTTLAGVDFNAFVRLFEKVHSRQRFGFERIKSELHALSVVVTSTGEL